MFIQFDDDGQKFVVAYVVSPITKHKPSKVHMRAGALQLFRLFHHFDVIFMVAHSF